jgi:DNA-directed RNA polymerase subunit D
VEICPKRVLAKTENRIEIKDLMACMLCQDCAEACRRDLRAIKVGWEENSFIFSLESTGGLPPERIMAEAVKILDRQLKEFESQIKVKKSEEG